MATTTTNGTTSGPAGRLGTTLRTGAAKGAAGVAAVALLALLGGVALLRAGWSVPRGGFGKDDRSCASFLMRHGGSVLVGHNLDESIEVPGQVVANPRGLAKENLSWAGMKSVLGRSASEPRRRWVARYGSLTYNPTGKEFPDGGMNEAGLYVGEMTLLGTRYPDAKVPRFYTFQWMQYLLDSFATVDEALASLATDLPDGHCQWHFFLADATGKAALVEFLEGKPVVFTGAALPHPIAGNDPYRAELEDLKRYAGFGGTRDPRPRYPREDPRFRWAAVMLREDASSVSGVERAFAVLERMDLGSNRWAIVFDLGARRMAFHTYRSRKVRTLDVARLDLSCGSGTRALDIHRDVEGDVSELFAPVTDASNEEAVRAFWSGADMGFLGNTFLRPRLIRQLSDAPRAFACAPLGLPAARTAELRATAR